MEFDDNGRIAIDGDFEDEIDDEVEDDVKDELANDKSGRKGGEEEKSEESKNFDAGKIFVGGVAWETTEDNFAAYFSKYGEITDSVLMRDKYTNKPRGFGFVTFADPSVIDKVLEDDHVIDGRAVEVKRTVPRQDLPSKAEFKTQKIFVGGIPISVAEDEFKEHFSSYGTVIEHQIMFDHTTGRSRGFGFITFENEDSVDRIISEGRMHDFGGKQVEIKRAEPKRHGADSGFKGRSNYRPGGGNAHANQGSSSYGYGSGYPSDNPYYGGGTGYGYGASYNYGGFPGYGTGYGSAFGGAMYGAGAYGAYGSMVGGYAGFYGAYGTGRGYGNRYHPYK